MTSTRVERLSCHVVGDGTPELVLVHGLFDSSRSWSGVAPRLADRGFTVVTLDLRGHGDSPKPSPPGHYAPETMAADVGAVMRALNLKSPVWVGHSMGARTGWVHAATDHTLRGLVIGDIGMDAQPTQWKDIQALVEGMPAEFIDADAAHRWMDANLAVEERAYFETVLFDRADRYRETPVAWRFLPAAMVEIVRHGRARDWIGVAPRVGCPVLLIRGQHSHELSRAESQRMRDALPDCSFVEIAQAGHDLHMTHPVEFADAVADWARRVVGWLPGRSAFPH